MKAPKLTAFVAPQGGAPAPWGGPAVSNKAPTLTAFAAPKGGVPAPWGGPAVLP